MADKQNVNKAPPSQAARPRKADRQIPIEPIRSSNGKPVPLIDIGANLTSKNFKDKDIPDILERASNAGVTHIILTGTSYKGSKEVLNMCAKYDGTHNVTLRCTIGIHPHDATTTMQSNSSSTFDTDLETLICSEEGTKYCVAVGECGLDYDRKFSTHDDQKHVFQKQLSLAQRLHKPVFLHSRDAHADFLSLLKPFLPHIRAVAHCHTDPSLSHLQELVDAGVYIGLTGMICDERPGRYNVEIIPHVPLERTMVETDSPYLFPRNVPRPWGKWQNEPCLTSWVVRKIAEVRGDVGEDEVARKTTEVAMEFFGLEGGSQSQ